VGSHLVDALVERGETVTCLVRKTSDLRWLEGAPVRLAFGDVTDIASLRAAVEGQEVVFHLAAMLRGNDRASFYRVNGEGTRNLAVACARSSPRRVRLVYLSSLAASGPSPMGRPRREEDPPEPVTDYGRSKLAGETALREMSEEVPFTILRPPAVYGPRETDIFLYFRWIERGLALFPGDGRQAFDFIYVRDLVEALLCAAESPDAVGETFFVNDGSHHTWRSAATVIAQTMGCHPVRVPVPLWLLEPGVSLLEAVARRRGKASILSRQKIAELRCSGWICDAAKAQRVLGFQPKYPLKRGVEETIRWYRKEGWLRSR